MTGTSSIGRFPVKRLCGFTLIELIMVLLIASVIVAGAFPSLIESIRNNEVASQNMSLIAMLNFARSEAIRRSTPVTMVMTANADGWEAIVEDPNNEIEIEGCVPGQLRCTSNSGVQIDFVSTELIFNNRGYIRGREEPWVSETIYLQHDYCSGENQRRRIDITPTGQVRSCSLPCDMAVISIGLAGVAVMQMTTLQFVHSAHYRSMVTTIALDLEERLWLELADNALVGCPDTGTGDGSPVAELLEHWDRDYVGGQDPDDWNWSTARMLKVPNLTITVGEPVTGTRVVQIPATLSWNESRFSDDEDTTEQFTYNVRIPCRGNPT
jgi:type IV fimbrial biogenesis protein FimT